MANGFKTGGRTKGTPNRPKVDAAPAEVASAPTDSDLFATTKGNRFPAYKLAKLDSLIPYATNARTHTEAQIAKIAASMKEFGFTNPVLTDGRKGIVAGHGRVLAAKVLGLDVVPTIELSHLSQAQRRAYVLADNRLAEDAGWDEALLATELGELSDLGFDLALTGFNERELAGFMGSTGGNADPDDVPEVPGDPVSEVGNVWILGDHRLVCGDCTDAAVVAHALGGAKPHLMVTDPPYGVEYDAVNARATNVAHGAVANDDRADWREAWELFPGHIAYVWHADLRSRDVVESLQACAFTLRAQIIWDKTRPVMSRGHYNFQHEPCWYAVRKGGTAHWSGGNSQSTVWAIGHRKSETGHSTQKPVECMLRPMQNNSKPGDAVYEPFSGSGTTIIAAEMTGRRCHAIEIAPQYIDVAVRRWQAFTGKDAILEATGATFEQTAATRLQTAA